MGDLLLYDFGSMRIIVAVLASLVWLKGNLHTHTARSDGDSAPEEMAAWYRDHGYQFLDVSWRRCRRPRSR
jgi:hypothetical protein